MSLLTEASLVITPNAVEEGKLFSIIPTDGSGDLTVVRATTATRVNSAGLIESVANNVPRLDYTNSSCPSILVEPQRTNLVLRSEEFDNLTVWPGSAGVTRLANQGIAPNGTNTMDLITFPISGNSISQSVTVINGTTYTFSVWLASQSGTQTVEIGNINSGIYQSVTVTTTPQRFEVTQVASSTNRFPAIRATATYSILAWGAQLEAGSYATSYIPTTTASVTRNLDDSSVTSFSSGIGQTEGVLFTEVTFGSTDNGNKWIAFLWLSASSYIGIYTASNGRITAEIVVNSGVQFASTSSVFALPNEKHKIALAYKANDFAFYIDGAQIALDNSGTVPACNQVKFIYNTTAISLTQRYYGSLILWKERLTNDQLAQLTTI